MIQTSNSLNPESVVAEYLPLVKGIAFRYKNSGLSKDDLIQEGMLGLLEACNRFDNQHNVQFSTYATFWIKKYILLAVSRELKQILHISYKDTEKLADTRTLVTTPPITQDNSNIEAILKQNIPELEKQIVLLSFKHGKTLKDIALELNLTPEKVKQLRTKALRRIKTNSPQDKSQEGCGGLGSFV